MLFQSCRHLLIVISILFLSGCTFFRYKDIRAGTAVPEKTVFFDQFIIHGGLVASGYQEHIFQYLKHSLAINGYTVLAAEKELSPRSLRLNCRLFIAKPPLLSRRQGVFTLALSGKVLDDEVFDSEFVFSCDHAMVDERLQRYFNAAISKLCSRIPR